MRHATCDIFFWSPSRMTGARRSHDRGGNGAGAGRRHVVGVSRGNGSAAVGPGTSDERVGGSWPAPPRRYLLGVCVCVCVCAWKEAPRALFFRLLVKGRHLQLTAAEVIASCGLNAVTDQYSARCGAPRDQSPARPLPDT